MTITVSGITEYGKKIQKRLVERNVTQGWLIAKVRKKTGLWFDGSYLHKVMTGKNKSEKIIDAINEILGIEV